MTKLSPTGGAFGPGRATFNAPRPTAEPIEPRRMLSVSPLSALSDPPTDAEDVMASFEEFLRDRAAQQYAARRNNITVTASPAGRAPATRTLRPATGGATTTTTTTTTTITTTAAPATTATATASDPLTTHVATIPGDVTLDGRVNADDIAIYDRGLARYQSGAIPPGAATLTDGDATGDGAVDPDDYALILSAIAAAAQASRLPPVLVPGTGFAGPTPQPLPVGSLGQQGYTEMPIARWDTVPFQTFDDTFNVGVVAFHIAGIDRVEFSVNGGRPAPSTAMTRNPQTGVFEYWATLDARRFVADGPVEVRAVVYPKAGVPRVLKPLPLNVNGLHTLPSLVRYVSPAGSNTTGDGSPQRPFRTIKQAAMSIQQRTHEQNVDDGRIYLLPGDYAFSGGWNGSAVALPLTEFAWLTVSAAPGVSPNQVRITAGGSAERLNASLIHLANLTVYGTGLVSSTNLNRDAAIWFDNCTLAGTDPDIDPIFAGPTAWNGGIYATGTRIRNAANGLPAARLLRDVHASGIASDAFQNAETVINCSAENLNAGDTNFHPDVVQFFSPAGTTIENRIIYGLDATIGISAQGVFAGAGFSLKDIAIVNCRIDNAPNVYYAFQFCGPIRHMYVARSVFTGPLGGVWRTDTGFTATNVLLSTTSFSNEINTVPGVTRL